MARLGSGVHVVAMTSNAMTLLEARTHYFASNGFGVDGGYGDAWVTIKLFDTIPVRFPNTPGRVRAVRYHDLHHVITGYQTDMHGEAEISTWELATNCRGMIAAWLLNAGGMAYGLLTAPRDMFRAWTRGRHSHNLYDRDFDDALLGRHVDEMRRELALDVDHPPTLADALTFAAASSVVLAPWLAALALVGWTIMAALG
jgi:hypothetical protein